MAARHVVLVRNTFDNLGDVAMLACELDALRRYAPGARVTALSDDRSLCAQFPEVTWGEGDLALSPAVPQTARAIARRAQPQSSRIRAAAGRAWSGFAAPYRRRSIQRFTGAAERLAAGDASTGLPARPRRLLESLRSADLVIGGGALMGSVPAVSDGRRAVYRALRALGVPYVLNGVSLTDPWTDGTFSGAALVVVRDRLFSAARALQCGVPPERLVEAVDPAFALPPADADQVRATLESLALASRAFLAVNVRQTEPARLAQVLAGLAATLPHAARQLHAGTVLLFGMQQFRENHDGDALERLRRLIAPELPVRVWMPDQNPALLKGVLAEARAVVSCRYHGAVFGLSSGVPTVGLVVSSDYDVKLRGLFQWYGLDRLAGTIVEFSGAAGPLWLAAILGHDDELRQEMWRMNAMLGADVKRAYERMGALAARR